jgi:hypothetical protein
MKSLNYALRLAIAGLFLLIAGIAPAQGVSTRNKVAVLPILYIGDVNERRAEDMQFYLQDITINFMNESAFTLQFMDAAEVNAILLKNGIDEENIRRYTMRDLATILQVEFVISGSVLQDNGNVVTVSSNTNTRRQSVDQWYGKRGPKVITRSHNSGVMVTRQNVETHVSLSIYNETGEKIYTKSRQSILSDADAYKAAMKYLLKRTPLYKR